MASETSVACSSMAVSVLRPDGRFLLLRRRGGVFDGIWSQVTGRQIEGEALWQTALRELREETGLVPSLLYSIGFCDQFYNPPEDRIEVVPVFLATVPVDAGIRLNDEHSDFQWMGFDQAKQTVPFAGHRTALEIIRQDFLEKVPAKWKQVWPERGGN